MNRLLTSAATIAATLSLAGGALAQNCYENHADQCFSFAPAGAEATRLDTGVNLRSKNLTVTGDIRFRYRGDDFKSGFAYTDGDQMTSRARVQLAYQATEKAKAVVEFVYAETWNGSESYSDALARGAAANPDADGVNFNGIGQAYIDVEDMFGAEDHWRVGRSTYILGNGLVLGSCDYLQYPDTFTGVWVSRPFGPVNVELFVLDDDGPLQSPRPGTRFWGGTAKVDICEGGVLDSAGVFFMAGSGDGDNINGNFSNDSWFGAEARGKLPWELQWNAEGAHRQDEGAQDVSAYSVRVKKEFADSILHSVAVTRTDSEGALHVNPADFNSAGLLHQYGGAWRSDLDTNQLAVGLRPGGEVDVDLKVLTFDRDGLAGQAGHVEFDAIVGRQFASGVHASAGYGMDNEDRQVAFVQLTLFF